MSFESFKVLFCNFRPSEDERVEIVFNEACKWLDCFQEIKAVGTSTNLVYINIQVKMYGVFHQKNQFVPRI